MTSSIGNWAQSAEEQQQKLSNELRNMKVTKDNEQNGENKPHASNAGYDASNNVSFAPSDTVQPTEESPDQDISTAEVSLLQKIMRTGLINSKHNIEVQRKDPNSPLYSVKTFEALKLRPELLKGLHAMGFDAPSKIQETALPTLLADPPQNMIAQSQSGTGKTAAFVLAMLSRVDLNKHYPQVLCLAPTYELALQIGEVAQKMAQFLPEIKIVFAVRGEERRRNTKLDEHIIIGTPGKVLDWSIKYKFFDLSKIKVFVLDEADVMIATQGHQDQSFRIHKFLPKDCQVMFFSATYEQKVMEFAEVIVSDPIIIRLKREEESLDNIKQYYVLCESQEAKFNAIANIYGGITVGQAIIFCHTKRTASWLAGKMAKDGHSVALLSGELTVEQRIAVLNRFRDNQEKVLITTNVLSRGIDIESVTVVVNFDLPVDLEHKADCETYLHRIGRTGRFGKVGLAINLVDRNSMPILKTIEHHFGKPILPLDTEDPDDINKLNQNKF